MPPPALIKTVVFDLGKVLVDFDYSIAARRLSAQSNFSPPQLKDLLDHSPLLFRLERGQMTTDQFYAEVCTVTGFRGSMTQFNELFADIFVPIEPMVQLHATLRDQGIPTFIFSNTNDLAISHIRRSFPFYSHFDGYVLSYQHGVMKPDAGLYQVVERLSGHCGSEILYLDDRRENIEAGAARCWQVILQESPQASIAAVRSLGLLP
jgi:glucose-1-phosphatase